MSLISDALRKADTGSGMPPEEPPSNKYLWIYRTSMVAAIAIVLVALAVLTRAPSGPRQTAAVYITPKTQVAQTSGTNLLRKAQGTMGLSGTMVGTDGESLAVVDNQIVQKGDRVRGMEVVRVNPESVELQDQSGKTKTLTLKN